jgi:hypothetical protein
MFSCYGLIHDGKWRPCQAKPAWDLLAGPHKAFPDGSRTVINGMKQKEEHAMISSENRIYKITTWSPGPE